MEESEYSRIIYPWQAYFDEKWQKNYYFNPFTNESVWDLPLEIQSKISSYSQIQNQIEDEITKKNMSKFLTKELEEVIDEEKQLKEILSRPARKQVERSLAEEYSYKQGDEEYNIWYDKFLTETKFKDKEANLTRCDPEIDSGYTKADLFEKFSTSFCVHFARGCCCLGVNCKYFHRIPLYAECMTIDNSKDIFGRSRFANYRDDMGGVGSFLKECRTLYINEFGTPSGNDPETQMYEVLWRHFSVWGEIEDINLVVNKNVAFIRYKHRCFAEFAKEAMMNRSLDSNEIITIKWANDDPNPKAAERTAHDQEKIMIDTIKKKKKNAYEKEIIDEEKNQMEKYEPGYGFEVKNNGESEKKKVIEENCHKMDQILKRIEVMNSGGNVEEFDDNNLNNYNNNQMPSEYFNDQPLIFKN